MKTKITNGEFKALKPGDRFLDQYGRMFFVRRNYTQPGNYTYEPFVNAYPDYGEGPLTSIITGPFYLADVSRVLPKKRNADRKAYAIGFRKTYSYSFLQLQKAAINFRKVLLEVFTDLYQGANRPAPKFEKGSISHNQDPEVYLTGPEPILQPWKRDRFRHILERLSAAPKPNQGYKWNHEKRSIEPINPLPGREITAAWIDEAAKLWPVYKAPADQIIAAYDPEYLRSLYQQKND